MALKASNFELNPLQHCSLRIIQDVYDPDDTAIHAGHGALIIAIVFVYTYLRSNRSKSEVHCHYIYNIYMYIYISIRNIYYARVHNIHRTHTETIYI